MWDFEGVVTVRLHPYPPLLQSQLVVRAERHVNLRNFHIQQKVEGWVTIWDVYSRSACSEESNYPASDCSAKCTIKSSACLPPSSFHTQVNVDHKTTI